MSRSPIKNPISIKNHYKQNEQTEGHQHFLNNCMWKNYFTIFWRASASDSKWSDSNTCCTFNMSDVSIWLPSVMQSSMTPCSGFLPQTAGVALFPRCVILISMPALSPWTQVLYVFGNSARHIHYTQDLGSIRHWSSRFLF